MHDTYLLTYLARLAALMAHRETIDLKVNSNGVARIWCEEGH